MDIQDLLPYLDNKAIKGCLSSDAFIVPFNPYRNVFPNRTVFRGYDLDLAKSVSEAGYRVGIPQLESTNKKEVLLQKQFDISNPLVIFIIGIPFSILAGIVSGLVVHLITRGKTPKILIIKISKQGKVENCYYENGEIVSDEKVKDIISKITTAHSYTSPSPMLTRPVPIHFEHTSKVVGWGNASIVDNGLVVTNVKIDDAETRRLIKAKKLIGFSIGGIAKRYECSICHKNYFLCKHIKGYIYNGKKAYCNIKNLDLAEISIVSDPANADALIKNPNSI